MHDDAARRCSLLRNIVVEREEPGELVTKFQKDFCKRKKSFFGFFLFSFVFLVVHCYVEDLLLKLFAGGVSKREKREERWQEV